MSEQRARQIQGVFTQPRLVPVIRLFDLLAPNQPFGEDFDCRRSGNSFVKLINGSKPQVAIGAQWWKAVALQTVFSVADGHFPQKLSLRSYTALMKRLRPIAALG